MCRLFSLVNRLEDVYNITGITSDIKSPVITGIALYKNYPIGTLFPRELLNYKTYLEILDNVSEISNDDRLKVLNRVKYLLEQLMKYDVYPTHIYGGNIMVNPNNYSDVRLDGLDKPMVCRVESEDYVRTLKKRGRNLVDEALSNFNRIFK